VNGLEETEREHADEQGDVGDGVMTRELAERQDERKRAENERDTAVEATRLGMRPGIERRAISRPVSESVHVCLVAHALQTCARAR